ncbi:uncharacterized protein [Phyllobates terribilis]|uniref:uncharacterized protein isoform X2 n=1 Tax=Phyllobates terribilis TaxID=111132 RepID=UPI003CCA78FC
MLQPLCLHLLLALGIQWILWAAAALLHTEKFYDLAGSGTFILLSHLSLRWRGTKFFRQQVQTGLVTVWAVRLGTFLFLRILRDGHDRRFDKVRDNPGMFFVYWTVQGIWIFVTLLPSLMLNLETRNKPLGLPDHLGWTLWALGFLIQAVSDQQKWSFKADPDNASPILSPQTRNMLHADERAIEVFSALCASSCSILSISRANLSKVVCGHTAVIQTTWGRSCSGAACFCLPHQC